MGWYAHMAAAVESSTLHAIRLEHAAGVIDPCNSARPRFLMMEADDDSNSVDSNSRALALKTAASTSRSVLRRPDAAHKSLLSVSVLSVPLAHMSAPPAGIR